MTKYSVLLNLIIPLQFATVVEAETEEEAAELARAMAALELNKAESADDEGGVTEIRSIYKQEGDSSKFSHAIVLSYGSAKIADVVVDAEEDLNSENVESPEELVLSKLKFDKAKDQLH